MTALKVKEDDTWSVAITGVPRLDQQDWGATLTQLTDIPIEKLKIFEDREPFSVSGACGFAALMAISRQCENSWEWNPMDSTFFTADPVLNAKIFSHLANLRRCLQAHDAPTYYCEFVLRVRGSFLKTSLHQVVLQQVKLGRGSTGTVSRFATGLLMATALMTVPSSGEGDEEEEQGSIVGYTILGILFWLLCWRAFCLCSYLRTLVRGSRPPSPRGPSLEGEWEEAEERSVLLTRGIRKKLTSKDQATWQLSSWEGQRPLGACTQRAGP